MAKTTYWTGLGTAVAQVSTQTWGTYDATTTRRITIGGVTYGLLDSGGNLTAALTAFATYLNLATAGNPSAHPYFSAITWTSSATTIIGTADVAGVPFIMTGSVSGGTGTVSNSGVQVDTTASAGPNDWSTVGNWSNGLPASTDTVIFSNNAINVCWGLTTAITGVAVIRVEQSYMGRIGLDYLTFATTANGVATVATALEYRPLYASIGTSSLRIGDASSIGSAGGSPRCMWDVGSTTTCTIEIINNSSSSSDTNRPSVRLLGALVSAAKTHVLNVRSAPGGVGLGNEVPGEAPAFLTVNITDTSGTSKIVTGLSTSLTTWIQNGGNNLLQTNNTLTTLTCNGGTLRTEGTGAVTTLNSYGGTVTHNSTGTTSTINMNGGALTSYGSSVARTWTTINLSKNSTLSIDAAVITYTTLAVQNRVVISAS